MVAERSVPERAVDSPVKAFCLEGDPKAVSSTAHRTEQAPAPAREHGQFVHVRMNVSKTTGPSETGAKHCVRNASTAPSKTTAPFKTGGPSIAYAMQKKS